MFGFLNRFCYSIMKVHDALDYKQMPVCNNPVCSYLCILINTIIMSIAS